jgi:hypothetical protein
MVSQKGNYRRGGLFLFVASLMALLIAIVFHAPPVALGSIAVFGLGPSVVLILIGNRRQSSPIKSMRKNE